jgi:hypothetical protein
MNDYMTENETKREAATGAEDWAIIPFDEAEDEARWTRLIEETDQLIEDAAALEAAHGKLLMENKLSDIKRIMKPTEDELF